MKKCLILLTVGFLVGGQIYSMEQSKAQGYSVQYMIDEGNLPMISEDGELTLSGKRLTSLKGLDNIKQPERVRTLVIKDTNIQEIPEGIFSSLVNVSRISIENNPIKEIKSGVFVGLKNLEELMIRGLPLSSLPEDLLDPLPNLIVLIISVTNIFQFPPKLLSHLTNLDTIVLAKNRLVKIDPNFFENQREVGWIDLGENRLTQVPAKLFYNNQALGIVKLHNNLLETLPEELFDRAQIHTLNVENNPLKPEVIENLIKKGLSPSHTVEMKYREYSVKDLIADLTKDERLEEMKKERIEALFEGGELNLNSRELTSLEGIDELSPPEGKQIIIIDLSNNKLKNVPDGSFRRFPDVLRIKLRNNLLTEVPKNLLGERNEKLNVLDLSGNHITELEDASFANYPRISVIDLRDNRISKISPVAFSKYNFLSEIHLDNNKLTYLPSGLFMDLANIRYITLTGNMLGLKKDYTFPNLKRLLFDPQKPVPLEVQAAQALATKLKSIDDKQEKAALKSQLERLGFGYLVNEG